MPRGPRTSREGTRSENPCAAAAGGDAGGHRKSRCSQHRRRARTGGGRVLLRQLNLALKFLLELVALAAFGFWGASLSDGVTAVLLAIGLPLLAAGVWGTFAAPRARRRLPLRSRVPFELGVFLAAAVALWRAGFATAAAVFAAIVIVNAVLLTTFDQWEM